MLAVLAEMQFDLSVLAIAVIVGMVAFAREIIRMRGGSAAEEQQS